MKMVHTLVARARTRQSRPRRAFTLIEVLVVVAIIALLVAILLPSLAEARRQARVVTCATNLRTVGNAMFFYCQANKDATPFEPNQGGGAIFEMIHPYLENARGRTSQDTSGNEVVKVNVDWYKCPDDLIQHESSEKRVDLGNGKERRYVYKFSYCFNNNVGYAQRPNQQNKLGIPRKLSSIKNPTNIVMFNDGNDDAANGAGGWYLVECNRPNWNVQVQFEMHHKTGNNFSYVDNHIEFEKLSWRGPQYGLPPFPFAWIPNGEGNNVADYLNWERPAPKNTPPQT